MATVADVEAQLEKVFLAYEAPKVVTSDAPSVSPLFTQQKQQLSDVPVVTTTDKVLDCVLPPRSIELEDGTHMTQRVSHKQAGREELSGLHQQFDFKLHDAKARKAGICPVRQSVYAMLFDELLRQVVIDNPERGLMLARVRDELRMSRDAYTTLYEASLHYSTRKMTEATRSLPELRERMGVLRDETDVLKKEQSRLQAKHAAMLRCAEEQQQADHRRFGEERRFLEHQRIRLQKHLDAVKEAQEAETRRLMAGMADDEEAAAADE